jgi:ATP-binding cassette, subfamily B, bacterial
MELQVRSALPGRVRWDVPGLLHRPSLAAAVVRELRERPAISSIAANPTTGRVLLEFDPVLSFDLIQDWLEQALEMAWRAPARLPAAEPSGSLSMLLERTGRHRGLVARTFAASFLNRLFEASPPLMIGTAVDIATRGRGSILGWLGFKTVSSQLAALGVISAAVWTLDALCDYAHRRLSGEMANLVRHDLRNEVYQHLQKLDMAQIERVGMSRWMNLLNEDIQNIHVFIQQGADPIVTILANGFIVGITFLLLSPTLAGVQLLMVPPLFFASTKMLARIRRQFAESRGDNEALNALLYGNVAGMATISAFDTADREALRVAEASQRQMDSEAEAQRLSAMYVPSLQMIVGGGFITTLLYGGALVSRGQLPAGAYNMMGYTELRLLVALGHVGVGLKNYQRTKVSIDRVLRVLQTQPTIKSGPIALPERAVGGEFTLDQVTFGYEADRSVLNGLTMTLPAGRTTGIVGETGAGKSTLLRMLLRFYDPRQGSVRLDGVDLRELRLEDLRGAIATVPQDVVLFAGSVRDNIAYARPGATMEEVRHAGQVAGADEFIEALPRGYHTQIGEGARGLSTGQRQRIAIARAALANRPILLFDEATSALDTETEATVQRALREVTANRTTVIVAHRLSTIRHADLIYVLDDGQVREQGRHEELLAADGVYASMWRVQTGELTPRRPGSA